MIYDLPTSVEVGGAIREINSDYRAALDMCVALSDPELTNEEKAYILLFIFYPNLEEIEPSHYQEAVDKCVWFLDGGKNEEKSRSPHKIMDWAQDFSLIVNPINRVIGREIREPTPLHWWTFLSAYYEIGDCLFSQVVQIRDKKAKGKPLEKHEREWYRNNRDIVDLKTTYTQAEKDLLAQFSEKGG